MRRPLAVIAVGVVLLGGCGGDEKQKSRSVTVKAGGTLRVVAREYSFDPGGAVVEGGPGTNALKITLDNKGTLAHNAKVYEGDREVGGTPTFPGGQARSGVVRLRPGKYRMVCTVGNHEQLGMSGIIEVRASG